MNRFFFMERVFEAVVFYRVLVYVCIYIYICITALYMHVFSLFMLILCIFDIDLIVV